MKKASELSVTDQVFRFSFLFLFVAILLLSSPASSQAVPLPTIDVHDAKVFEGNAGTSTAYVNVTLSAPGDSVVTVNYVTSDGTATAGSDYTSASGTVTFQIGEVSKAFPVTVNGDTDADDGESFSVTLTSPSGGVIGNSSGTVYITDEAQLQFSRPETFQRYYFMGSDYVGGNLFPSMGSGLDMASGDLDGDGNRDVITTGYANNQYLIWKVINRGDGSFKEPSAAGGGASTPIYGVAVGDLDNDGDLDYVYTNTGSTVTSGSVHAGLNDGSGFFNSGSSYTLGDYPSKVVVANLNTDNYPDIAVTTTNQYGGLTKVKVLLNNGDGSFGTPAEYFAGRGSNIDAADLDGDGYTDLVVTDTSNNKLSILFNVGSTNPGVFSGSVAYQADGGPQGVVTGDFDSDGDPDVATADYSGKSVSVFFNNAGNLAMPVTYDIGIDLQDILALDMDQDGHLDLVGQAYGGELALLLNNRDGSFSPPQYLKAGRWAITGGDFDSDGDTDIITAPGVGYNGIVLLRNKQAHERTFSPPDTFAKTAYGNCFRTNTIKGDFNNDGRVDILMGSGYSSPCGTTRYDFFENNGDRTFADPASRYFFLGETMYGVPIVDDFSGDGIPDIANPRHSGYVVEIRHNDGTGYGGTTYNHAPGWGTLYSIASSDVDRDGDRDIVVAAGGAMSTFGYYFTVLFNNGISNFINSGTWEYNIPDDTFNPTGVVSTDLDGDTFEDLMFIAVNSIYPLISNGPGTYNIGSKHVFEGSPRAPVTVDMTGDGLEDLVMFVGNKVAIMNSLGDGNLSGARYLDTGNIPAGMDFGDLDNDGDTDLIVSFYDQAVNVYLNDGSGGLVLDTAGTFYPPGDTNWGATHAQPAMADWDSDGALDMFIYTRVSQTLTTNARDLYSWYWNEKKDSRGGIVDLSFSPSTVVVTFSTTGTVTLGTAAPAGGAKVYLECSTAGVTLPAFVNVPAGQRSADFTVSTDANSEGLTAIITASYGSDRIAGSFYVEPVYPVNVTFSPAAVLGSQTSVGTVHLNGPAKSTGLTVNISSDNSAVKVPFSLSVPAGQTTMEFDITTSPVASIAIANVTASTADGSGTGQITVNPVDGGSVSYNPEFLYSGSAKKAVEGDIDGDGDLDIIGGMGGGTNIMSMSNDGAGRFATAIYHAAGSYPYSVDRGDLDGDGDIDIVVAIRGANSTDGNQMAVLFNDGSGDFSNVVTYDSGNTPEDVVLGDFDGDGDLDAATGNQGVGEGITIFINDGTGAFSLGTPISAFVQVRKLKVVDINSDGYDDLLALHNQAYLRILRNNQNGTFTLSDSILISDLVLNGWPENFDVGDLDGDGDLDIALSIRVSTYLPNKRLMLLFNNGFGGFSASPTVFELATYVGGDYYGMPVKVEDLDGDGDQDIAVGTGQYTNPGKVHVLLNDGNALFEVPLDLNVGIRPSSLIANDIDSDGDADLVVVHENSQVYVFLNDQFNQILLSVSEGGTGTGIVNSDIPGISCGTDCGETYDLGTVVTLTAYEDVSSTFTGWSGDCTGTGTCQVTLDVERNVTANYDIKTLDITAASSAGGSISPSGTVSVNYGASRAFNITPQTGYHVLDVTVDGGSQGALTSYSFTNVTAAHTINAAFEINSYLIIANVPGLYGTLSCTSPVTYWGTATCTATPDVGYHVSSLTDNGVDRLAWLSGNTYTISGVSTNHSVVAAFEVNSYNITASAGSNGSITPAGATPVTHGGTQSYTITPDSGYRVLNVLVDGAGQGAITSYTFTNVQAAHTIQVSFELLPDSDGDGLADDVEASLGTNPGLADTDGDGFDDGVEVTLGSDPLVLANVPVAIVISDGGGLEGVERADGGSDSDNLDTASGNPVIDKEFVFTLTVNATSAPGSVKVYMTQRTNPVPGDFYGFDLTCTGDFITGATCQYPTILGPAATHKYYFTVTMSEGTAVRHPLSGYLTGPQVQAITGFSLLGLPRAVDYAGIDGLSAMGSTRVYRWAPSLGYYTSVSGASPVTSGEGYFVFSESQTLPELEAYGDSPNAQYAYQLASGWNLISNPYEGNVELGNVMVKKGSEPPVSWLQAVLNGWIINAIYYYNGEDWGSTYSFVTPQTGARLVPWLGYWVDLQVSDDTYYLIIPRP